MNSYSYIRAGETEGTKRSTERGRLVSQRHKAILASSCYYLELVSIFVPAGWAFLMWGRVHLPDSKVTVFWMGSPELLGHWL